MLPWKRPEWLLGTLLLSSVPGTVMAADEVVPGRAGLASPATPLEEMSQEVARQRWQRLKSRYESAPQTADSKGESPQPANGWNQTRNQAAPLPMDVEESIQAAGAPLPDGPEEPAWVLTAAPLDQIEAEPQPKPVAPRRDRAMRTVSAVTAPAPTSSPYEQPVPVPQIAQAPGGEGSLLREDPAFPAKDASDPPSVRRPVRSISEIHPFYDTQVDQDIREYAEERADDYDVKFGSETYVPRTFQEVGLAWEPSNFYHFPLYFEDVPLERYGHSYSLPVQSAVSIAKFSGQLLAIPYQMTIDPPNKCMYALGYYRPGEVAPKLKYQIPFNAQAAAVQAGVVTGLFFLIP